MTSVAKLPLKFLLTMSSNAAKTASTWEMKWCFLSVRRFQSKVLVARLISLAAQNKASAFLYICQILLCWMGKRTKRWEFAWRSGSGLAVLCFDGGLREEKGVVIFCAAWVELMQNTIQLSLLLCMKLVMSQKAWYVTTCCRGMVLG